MGSLPAVVRSATTTERMRIGLYTSAQSSYAPCTQHLRQHLWDNHMVAIVVGRYLCDSRYAIRIPAGTLIQPTASARGELDRGPSLRRTRYVLYTSRNSSIDSLVARVSSARPAPDQA